MSEKNNKQNKNNNRNNENNNNNSNNNSQKNNNRQFLLPVGTLMFGKNFYQWGHPSVLQKNI